MIEKLTLENFQSHKYTELEFAPGLNAIIGQSDTGKSAILRALRWVITNRPSGEAYRSYWGGDTEVIIQLDNSSIMRYKSASGNGYKLNGSVFQAIGTTVPDEIASALAIDEVNFQQQLDRPFLLDSSPGEVAQHFNRVAGLDKIDSAVQTVQSKIRQINSGLAAAQTAVAQGTEELAKYSFLPNFEIDLISLETLQSEARKIQSDIDFIRSKLEQYKKIEEEERKISKRALHEKAVSALLMLISKSKEETKKANKIKKVIFDLKSCEATIASIEDSLKRKIEEFNAVFPDICPLCGQVVKKKGAK